MCDSLTGQDMLGLLSEKRAIRDGLVGLNDHRQQRRTSASVNTRHDAEVLSSAHVFGIDPAHFNRLDALRRVLMGGIA